MRNTQHKQRAARSTGQGEKRTRDAPKVATW
jgi:hypothetical protein